MVTQASNCDREQLRQLLEGTLSDGAQATVTAHLEYCAECRRDLERFAAADGLWCDIRDALSGLVPTGDLTGNETTSRAVEPGESIIPLDFLAPSDNPAMLGRLGDFEILEEIGCGGMGIVFKGYDHELNRFVAVKVLHPYCATSAAARQRFAREAQAAAAVVHQHVVAIHAVDANYYPPYLVMPFIPGESLQQRLNRQGPFAVVDVLRIGQQVAEGLAAAHEQGLVHRDIKPGNILLERNVERVLLTDFGLARAADDASLTRSGVIAGTPQYMSPEQARGEQIDHRTDLFSLGTVLYTLLAGHSPFRAESAMGVLKRVCDDTPRPLPEVNPGVPEWLAAVIGKLQAKQPADRFESAAQVAELLKAALAHLQQPTIVPLPDEIGRLVAMPGRKKIRVLAAGLIALVVLSLIGLSVRSGFSPPQRSSIKQSADLDEWNDLEQNNVKKLQERLKAWDNDADF